MPPLSFDDNATATDGPCSPQFFPKTISVGKPLTQEVEEQEQLLKTKNSNSSKQVNFVRKVRIRKIPLCQAYSTEMHEALYYTSKEYKAIRTVIIGEIQLIRDGPCQHNDEVCVRGLEHESTPEGKSQRKQNKIQARKCVMEEQAFQKKQNIPLDADYLSELYRKKSKAAIRTALERARGDEAEARDYFLTGC